LPGECSSRFTRLTATLICKKNLRKKYNLTNADAAQSRDGLFHRLLWRIYSAGDQTGMQIKHVDAGASHEFSHSFILMGWALYQLVVAIIMINLLIAVMNNTFSEVWQTADTKWKYSRSYYQANFLRKKSTFPPPFQWIYYIARLVNRCKKGSATKDDKKYDQEQKLEYLKLLKELILTKQKNEFENSEEDNIEDLRAHLKQDMAEEMQKMKLEIMDKLSK